LAGFLFYKTYKFTDQCLKFIVLGNIINNMEAEMQRKKRVLVIFIGGTIASGFQGKGKKATDTNNRVYSRSGLFFFIGIFCCSGIHAL